MRPRKNKPPRTATLEDPSRPSGVSGGRLEAAGVPPPPTDLCATRQALEPIDFSVIPNEELTSQLQAAAGRIWRENLCTRVSKRRKAFESQLDNLMSP